MATLEKRGDYWRVKIRRNGFPVQTRSFDTKAVAERWARDIENEMDKGVFFDRTESEKNTLRDVLAGRNGIVALTWRAGYWPVIDATAGGNAWRHDCGAERGSRPRQRV